MHEQQTFRLIVDHRPYEWPREQITGVQIKSLAGVDASYGVWQQLPSAEDPEILDNQVVDLSAHGTEKFFTGKKTTTEG